MTATTSVVNSTMPGAIPMGPQTGLHAIADRRREAQQAWRNVLQIHPAAALFPMLSPDELDALAKDIAEHGLAERIVYTGTPGAFVLLDGRNRLDALAQHGRHAVDDRGHPLPEYCEHRTDIPDVAAWSISKNIKRRHLTAAQRRDLIAELLKLTPDRSNNAIAKTINVDDKTVAAVRSKLEATSEIPKLTTTIGTDGKTRPAKKTSTTPPATITPETTAVTTNAPATPAHISDPDEVQAIIDQIDANLAPPDLFRVVAAAIKKIVTKKNGIMDGFTDSAWRRKFEAVAKESRQRSKGRKS